MGSPDHRAFSARRLMIMAAPNGARRSPADHAALPVTPSQLADDARDLLDEGVAVLHLHVRDRDGGHTLDTEAYRAAISAIRRRVGEQLVIQVTSEAVGRYTPEQQMRMVRELGPEAVSLALNELCPVGAGESQAARFFAWLKSERIWPQYILYSPAELQRFERLRRAGLFSDDHPFVMLVLGSYVRNEAGTTEGLAAYLAAGDCNAFPWSACCFGRSEQKVMLAACEAGGHVRLGFENNLWLPDGRVATSNAELVQAFTVAADTNNRPAATAEEVRELFC